MYYRIYTIEYNKINQGDKMTKQQLLNAVNNVWSMNSEICKDKNMSVADCVEITVCILTKMGVPSAQALVEALVNLNKGESLA